MGRGFRRRRQKAVGAIEIMQAHQGSGPGHIGAGKDHLVARRRQADELLHAVGCSLVVTLLQVDEGCVDESHRIARIIRHRADEFRLGAVGIVPEQRHKPEQVVIERLVGINVRRYR